MPRLLFRLLTSLLLLLLGLTCAVPGAAAARPPLRVANPPWLAAQESQGIVYFAFTAPPRVRRYDLGAEAWLPDVGLAEAPTAFTVDAAHLFVGFGRRTSRFALDGTGEVHLKNTPQNADTLFVVGNALYIASYGNFWSVDKLSGTEIDTAEFFYSVGGVSVAPTLHKVFARSTNVSPADIVQISLNADGSFGEMHDSPYHGDYPYATRTYVFPGEARVADDAGIVYNTGDLTYSKSLGGAFDDLAFYGDLPIVLRGGEVVAYSNAFLETGRYQPAKPPLKIAVRGQKVFSFYLELGALAAQSFPLALLQPAQPGQPVNPDGLAYAPDEVLVGADGVVYLLSRANLSVFRWSISARRYLDTIPLVEAPSYMAYSAKTHRLYLSYPAGPIHQIRLGESPLRETPFVNSPDTPCGLATAGEFVFVCDPSGAWVSHFTYDPNGSLLSQVEWNYYSEEYVWSEVNRRMYFFRDDTSPNDVHWEEVKPAGALGSAGESPYHGEIRTIHPLRVSPDGTTVVLGSGEIFDAHTLVRRDALSNDVAAIAWNQGTLFTLRPLGGGTELQKWGTHLEVAAHRTLPGTPLRLFGRGADLLAVTSVDGVPRFSFWDNALNGSISAPPLGLAEGRFTVQVVWHTAAGAAGEGHPVALTRDTGYFWFFSPGNVEMILKVLDACAVNGRYWIFAGGLTDVGVDIVVVDQQTGQTRTYTNPQGHPFQPIQDTVGLAGCPADRAAGSPGVASLPAAEPWPPGAASAGLLLNDSRFDVAITWQTASGETGTGHAVALSGDTGYFWFFGPDNVEVVAKVLDGCAVNGRFWVFAGGLTDVHTEIRVTDTVTGAARSYVNAQGHPFQPLQDTGAFPCP